MVSFLLFHLTRLNAYQTRRKTHGRKAVDGGLKDLKEAETSNSKCYTLCLIELHHDYGDYFSMDLYLYKCSNL